jgi:release factor glutamine methyltransferase
VVAPNIPDPVTFTVARWSRVAAQRLEGLGWHTDDARRDVSVIARRMLGWDQGDWILQQQSPLSLASVARLDALVERRGTHEPVAYITGEREFFGRPFQVTPAVLIPRPETELVVETAGEILGTASPDRPTPHVVDVGTGSGCLAVTLALEHPTIRVTATDISGAAIEVASGNIRRHGVSDRVDCLETDLLGHLADVDLIVSNPPYVAERVRGTLSPDVEEFEPATALFGGSDGLDVIRRLLAAARRALRPGGAIVFEIGSDQGDGMAELVAAHDLVWRATRLDMAGHARVVIAHRRADSV